MEVILLKNVRSRKRGNRQLGKIGDIIEVKGGFANNYLFPQGIACFATEAAREEVRKKRAELEKQADEELHAAQAQGEKLAGVTLQISQKAGMSGLLFGSVTKEMIVKTLKEQGFIVERSQVTIPDGLLKRVGDHVVQVELHAEVLIDVNVSVLAKTA